MSFYKRCFEMEMLAEFFRFSLKHLKISYQLFVLHSSVTNDATKNFAK